jgi:hypothetical protein
VLRHGKAVHGLFRQQLQTAALGPSGSSAALFGEWLWQDQARSGADWYVEAGLGLITVADGSTEGLGSPCRPQAVLVGLGRVWFGMERQGWLRQGLIETKALRRLFFCSGQPCNALARVRLFPYYPLFCSLALYYEMSQHFLGCSLAMYCLFNCFCTMQGFAALTILSGAFVVLGWSHIARPLPEDNLKAYQDCSKLHPQKYCVITYFPSELKAMKKN